LLTSQNKHVTRMQLHPLLSVDLNELGLMFYLY